MIEEIRLLHLFLLAVFISCFIGFTCSQAIKECVHYATSLSEGVLRVGMLGWPLEVSASHITQLQFATTVENIMETTLHQVSSLLDSR